MYLISSCLWSGGMKSGSARVFEHQVPGGQYSNLLGTYSTVCMRTDQLVPSFSLPFSLSLLLSFCLTISVFLTLSKTRTPHSHLPTLSLTLTLSPSNSTSLPLSLPPSNWLSLTLPHFFPPSLSSSMQVNGHPGQVGGSARRLQGRQQTIRRHHQGRGSALLWCLVNSMHAWEVKYTKVLSITQYHSIYTLLCSTSTMLHHFIVGSICVSYWSPSRSLVIASFPPLTHTHRHSVSLWHSHSHCLSNAYTHSLSFSHRSLPHPNVWVT